MNNRSEWLVQSIIKSNYLFSSIISCLVWVPKRLIGDDVDTDLALIKCRYGVCTGFDGVLSDAVAERGVSIRDVQPTFLVPVIFGTFDGDKIKDFIGERGTDEGEIASSNVFLFSVFIE